MCVELVRRYGSVKVRNIRQRCLVAEGELGLERVKEPPNCCKRYKMHRVSGIEGKKRKCYDRTGRHVCLQRRLVARVS